jgi:hypothetical protein
MCNAWNHSPGCTCGFGGEGHKGKAGSLRTTWCYRNEDFCQPTKCPKCGGSVYFVRHNGGSVWFDDLGLPWPKHPCFNDTMANQVHRRLTEHAREVRSPLMGIVIETEIRPNNVGDRVSVRCADDTIVIADVSPGLDLKNLVGELVVVSRQSRRLIHPFLLGSNSKLPSRPALAPVLNAAAALKELVSAGMNQTAAAAIVGMYHSDPEGFRRFADDWKHTHKCTAVAKRHTDTPNHSVSQPTASAKREKKQPQHQEFTPEFLSKILTNEDLMRLRERAIAEQKAGGGWCVVFVPFNAQLDNPIIRSGLNEKQAQRLYRKLLNDTMDHLETGVFAIVLVTPESRTQIYRILGHRSFSDPLPS